MKMISKLRAQRHYWKPSTGTLIVAEGVSIYLLLILINYQVYFLFVFSLFNFCNSHKGINFNRYKVRSEHLHENLQSTSDFKPSDSCSNFLKVSESRVKEMETGKVNIFHLVEVNHALMNVFIPCHPGLFFIFQFLYHLWALNWIVLAVHSHEVSIQRNGLRISKHVPWWVLKKVWICHKLHNRNRSFAWSNSMGRWEWWYLSVPLDSRSWWL